MGFSFLKTKMGNASAKSQDHSLNGKSARVQRAHRRSSSAPNGSQRLRQNEIDQIFDFVQEMRQDKVKDYILNKYVAKQTPKLLNASFSGGLDASVEQERPCNTISVPAQSSKQRYPSQA